MSSPAPAQTEFGSSHDSTSTVVTSPTQDYLGDLFQKRLHSFTYLKRSLSSKQAWFNTILMTRSDLTAAFDHERMRKRTIRFTLLGISLSSIIELQNPADMAKAIISLINELDSYPDDVIASLGIGGIGNSKPRMKNFFKSSAKTLKRSAANQALSEFSSMDGGPSSAVGSTITDKDYSYLVTPNVPFQLDFFQTFFTLCDLLAEIYHKFLGFLSPTSGGTGVMDFPSPPTDAMSPLTQELLIKADAKVKKMFSIQVKEIDALARQLIKDELSSLDPLMKDFNIGGGGSSIIHTNGIGPQPSVPSTAGLPSNTQALPFSFPKQQASSPPSRGGMTGYHALEPTSSGGGISSLIRNKSHKNSNKPQHSSSSSVEAAQPSSE